MPGEKHISFKLTTKTFRQQFENYFNALSAFGYRYVKDVAVVEDFIQETFVSLWEKQDDFNHTAGIKSFLYTSMRNKCLNYLKHQNVQLKHEQQLVYELESEQFLTRHIIEEEVFNQLHQAIRDLPKSAQEIMFLSLNGLKNNEIAKELGISFNTVKTQKKIAYKKLKDKISPFLNGILLAI